MSKTTSAPWIPVAGFVLALSLSIAAGTNRGFARFRAPAGDTGNLVCKSNLHDMSGTLQTKNFVGNANNPDKAHGQISLDETCDYNGGVIRDDNPKANSNAIHFTGSISLTFQITDANGQSTKVMTVPLKAKPNPSPDKTIKYVGEGSTPGLQASFESNGGQLSSALKNLIGQLQAGGAGVGVVPKEWWTQISGVSGGTSTCTESGQPGPCDADSIILNLFLEPDADGDGKKEGSVTN